MKLTPPFRGVPVDVPDVLVDRYVELGYTIEPKKATPKRSRVKAAEEE